MNRLGLGLYTGVGGQLLVDLAARGRGARFSTNERGFARLSVFLPCTLTEAFQLYDRPSLPHMAAAYAGMTVWEGRLEDVSIEPSGVRLTAFGYSRGYTDAPYSESHIGVTARDIAVALAAAVGGLNSFMSSSAVLLQDPGVTLAEVYEDRYPVEILDRLCSLGDTDTPPRLWEAPVWEGRLLAFRPRGDAAREWYIDVSEPSIERTLDDLANSVYAVYQDGGNARTLTATSADAASASRYGLTRRLPVRVQTQDATLAESVRDAFLDDHKAPPARGAVRLRELYDRAGVRYPAFVARSGDTITLRNLPPTLSTDIDRIRTFRIKETEYEAEADELTVQPEALRSGLSAQALTDRARTHTIMDPNFLGLGMATLAALYADFQGLPGLRGLWYPNSTDSTGALYDQSGQGRTLTYNGNPTLGIHNSFIPYWDYDGTGDFHSRADEASLDITGGETTIAAGQRGLTLFGWFWFDVLGALVLPFGKAGAAGNLSYYLQKQANDTLRFTVSGNGTNEFYAASAALSASKWYFCVGRFTPSAEVAILVNGVEVVNTTSIPATVFSGNGSLGIGRWIGGATQELNGRCALAGLCAALLTDAQVGHLFQRTRAFFSV